MSQEVYSSLTEPGTTRLLRLLPNENEHAEIQCQLINYSLRSLRNEPHLYEALSYTWGGSEKPCSICVNGHQLAVTTNLQVALSQLRNSLLERYLWVDAVCINQDDVNERGIQVQHMASIYSKANRVIIWLGEATDGSDRAFEEILDAADESMERNSGKTYVDGEELESKHEYTLKLLQRSWFRRIWVLQEVAAARNILIMCGSDQMDSHTFCLGLKALNISYEGHPELQSVIQTVTFLIRSSVFRRKHIAESSGTISLNIRPLGSLIDMYHTHEATVSHDKIYALLGMSTQSPHVAGLVPDYRITWDELAQKLLLFIVGSSEYAETWVENGRGRIKSRGYVLGSVNAVKPDSKWDDKHEIDFDSNSPLARSSGRKISIILQVSANPVYRGDIVCVLEGHTTVTIIRPYEDAFSVVIIAAQLEIKPVKNRFSESTTILNSLKAVPRCLRLVWDFEKTLANEEYGHKFAGRPPSTETTMTSLTETLERSSSLQDSAWIFADIKNYQEAVARYEESTRVLGLTFGEAHPRTLESKVSLVMLYMKSRRWILAESLLLSVAKANQMVNVAEEEMLSVTLEPRPNLRALGEKLIMMIRLLEPRESTDKIRHEEVLYIFEHFDEQWVTLLLDGRWGNITITNSILVAAAQNKRNGAGDDILSLILRNTSVKLEITEAVVVACCRNTHRGEDLMRVLLDSWEDSLPVTEKVVSGAAQNQNTSVMELLFKRKDDLQITAKVLESAATNSYGIHMFDLIRHERGEFVVTEAMVIAAACNCLSGLGLLEYFAGFSVNELPITEQTLAAAAGNPDEEVIEYLLKKARKGNLINETVLKEAARNSTKGFPIMKLLLEEKQGDVTITEAVIEAAAGNQPHARMLELLLHHDGPDPRVTENVLCAAAAFQVNSGERGQSHQDSLQFLLARRGEGVSITERLIELVSKIEQYDQRLIKLLH